MRSIAIQGTALDYEFLTFLLTCVVVLKTLWHHRASV